MNSIYLLLIILIIFILTFYIINYLNNRINIANYRKAGKKWESIVKELSERK